MVIAYTVTGVEHKPIKMVTQMGRSIKQLIAWNMSNSF